MILVIRISGMVEVSKKVQETLFRMHLRRKYTAVLLPSTSDSVKLLKSVRNFVAYGDIDAETLSLLIEKRAISNEKKKVDAAKVIEEIEKKSPNHWSIKPYFRLHPPRGGIDSKLHYPLRGGVLGDNKKDINVLARRML